MTVRALSFVSILLLTATPALAADGQAGDGSMVALWFIVRLLILSGLMFASVAAFKVPGTGIPETIAVVLLSALLVPAVISGTAQWYEIVAIVGGIALLAIEVFVIPGFGATGLLGALLIFGGLTMIFVPDPRGVVHLTLADFRTAGLLLIGGMLGGTAAIALLGRYLPNLPRAHRLILNETNATPLPGEPRLCIGDVGLALTDMRPGGVLRVAITGDDLPHRDVSVVSDRGFVTAGTRVVVADIEGSKVVVRPDPTLTA